MIIVSFLVVYLLCFAAQQGNSSSSILSGKKTTETTPKNKDNDNHPSSATNQVTPSLKGDSAYQDFNCSRLLEPVFARRAACKTTPQTQVDVCVMFAYDYKNILPFLLHYTALGVRKIWLYNNDDEAAWYLHPTVVCLVSEGLVGIHPWKGDRGFYTAIIDCQLNKILGERQMDLSMAIQAAQTTQSDPWLALFDVDELLVLHKHSCLPEFLAEFPTDPAVHIHWAKFIPNVRRDSVALFGDVRALPPEQLALVDYRPNKNNPNNNTEDLIMFPHDYMFERTVEDMTLKSITRTSCIKGYGNPHVAYLSSTCSYSRHPVDPNHKSLNISSPVTSYQVRTYPVAQLNHYWSASYADFLRKMHRGKGMDQHKTGGNFRTTDELLQLYPGHEDISRLREQTSKKHNRYEKSALKGTFVVDNSFQMRYGAFFKELKRLCHACFDPAYFHLQDTME